MGLAGASFRGEPGGWEEAHDFTRPPVLACRSPVPAKEPDGIIPPMSITIKDAADIEGMRVACRLAAEVLDMLTPHVKAGITTLQLDKLSLDYIVNVQGCISAMIYADVFERFPKLKIVKGSIGADGKASLPELQEAIEWCDFLLHGSGASLVAAKDVAAFIKHTGKPYGVYGITLAYPGVMREEMDPVWSAFKDGLRIKAEY